MQESNRSNVYVRIAKTFSDIPEIPETVELQKKLIKKLKAMGPQFLGSLIITNKEKAVDILKWKQCLEATKKPIVWFNAGGQYAIGDNTPESTSNSKFKKAEKELKQLFLLFHR